MRVVLSKKGFDSCYGERPSIIENDVFYSVPIPEINGVHQYRDIMVSDTETVCDVARRYYQTIRYKQNEPLIAFCPDLNCHPDPDLTRGAFGQVDDSKFKPQTHLASKGVEKDSIFLFFGRFIEGKDGRCIGCERYVMWGYLIVSDIVHRENQAEKLKEYPWLSEHPHIKNDKYANDPTNCIYIGTNYGKFRYSRALNLTMPYAQRPSQWEFPETLNGITIECENKIHNDSIKAGVFELKPTFGQEFVMGDDVRARVWAEKIIKNHT